MRLILRVYERLAPTPDGEAPHVEALPVPSIVQIEVGPDEAAQVSPGDGVTVVLRGIVQAKV